jgi:hypothetical protein
MDWFRWWHGTVTDPKFQWVARRSGQSVASVLAVWAVLLEIGSTATHGNADATRGNVASLQCEDWDVALGLEDGAVHQIYSAMEQKGLIEDSAIVAWESRQPKREDAGNPNTGALSSTERSRLYREKLKREETERNEMQRDATQSTAKKRLDKSKPKEEANASVNSSAAAPTVDAVVAADGNSEETGDQPHVPACPVKQIVALYHECMPENPRVRMLDDARTKAIRARWKQASSLQGVKPFGYLTGSDGLAAWRTFFEVCADSDFLTGKAKAQPGKPPFVADIDFLMSPSGFKKCIENKYHREAA